MDKATEEGLEHLEDLQKKLLGVETENRLLKKQLEKKEKEIIQIRLRIKETEKSFSCLNQKWGENPIKMAIKDLNDVIVRLNRYNKNYLDCLHKNEEAENLARELNVLYNEK